jgi:hypothetical protein
LSYRLGQETGAAEGRTAEEEVGNTEEEEEEEGEAAEAAEAAEV